MIEGILLLQIIFVLIYPTLQYKRNNPDIYGSLICIGNFQFVTIPLIVYKYDFRNIVWYPYYDLRNTDFSYLVIYTTACIILFLILNTIIKFNSSKNTSMGYRIAGDRILIVIIMLFILIYKFSFLGGYLFQAIDYILQGFSAYIFLIFLLRDKKNKYDYLIIVLSLATFYGSSVRFVYIIVALLMYISQISKKQRPGLIKIIIYLLLIAICSIYFKIYFKNNIDFDAVFDNIYHRIITFDLSNIESLWIAAHYNSAGNLLLGKTFFSSLIIPWLLDDSFVGMGKYYINNILVYENVNKAWSLSYPFPYELLANFGFILGALFFPLFYLTIKFFILNKINDLNLLKNLFGLSFIYFTFRGDFVFAFTPTLFSIFGGFLAHLLLFKIHPKRI